MPALITDIMRVFHDYRVFDAIHWGTAHLASVLHMKANPKYREGKQIELKKHSSLEPDAGRCCGSDFNFFRVTARAKTKPCLLL